MSESVDGPGQGSGVAGGMDPAVRAAAVRSDEGLALGSGEAVLAAVEGSGDGAGRGGGVAGEVHPAAQVAAVRSGEGLALGSGEAVLAAVEGSGDAAAAKGSGDKPFTGPDTVKLRDPKAMRALAHPLRLRLLGELRIRGPQSVGMLCDIVDEAPGSVSYHVGKLAEFGFVEQAPELARDRRERWWRASHRHTTWSPLEDLGDPERRLASSALRREIANRYASSFETYLDAEPAMDPEWVSAATTGDSFLNLTLEQMTQLQSELNDLVARWEERSAEGPGAGTEIVSLVYQLYRRPE